MFKILILLVFPYILFASCEYTQSIDFKFDISKSDALLAKNFVKNEMLKKGYSELIDSDVTVDLVSRLEASRSRFNIESTLELRVNGSLDIYSYGEGRKYKKSSRARSLKNIKKSLFNAIKQIPGCPND